MSAIFYLLYHGHYVRIVQLAGRSSFELVERTRATPFISQAEAYQAALTHGMTPEQVQIEGNAEGRMQNAERAAS